MGFSDHHHSGHDGVLAIAAEEVDEGNKRMNNYVAGCRISIELSLRRTLVGSVRY